MILNLYWVVLILHIETVLSNLGLIEDNTHLAAVKDDLVEKVDLW